MKRIFLEINFFLIRASNRIWFYSKCSENFTVLFWLIEFQSNSRINVYEGLKNRFPSGDFEIWMNGVNIEVPDFYNIIKMKV